MQIINDSISWFTGVVEDRMDPLKRGRVRVRVYGLHPYQKTQGQFSGLPTSDLIWMDVLSSTNSASISGVGMSPTGIVEGTSVYGHWLDTYKTAGLILGTWGASRNTMPNYTEGFSDPTGQYPRRLGNDTNYLSQGDQKGLEASVNQIQNSNLVTGINPSDSALADIPEDPNPNFTIEQMLRKDEGLKTRVYFDSLNYPTIGIGHLITKQPITDMGVINKILSNQLGREVTGNPGSITMDEVSTLFARDISSMQNDIKTNSDIAPVYNKVNRSRQMALENMAFQMGVGGLAGFTRTLEFMYNGDWKSAYNALRDSKWYNQTPGRASAVSYCILVGNMEAYGVMPPDKKKNLSAAATVRSEASDPSDPYTPTDTRILFQEPDSSYKGQYPYVHTYESESGHIQEFDDTPGQERYRLVHPSGVFVEVNPAGNRTIKSKELYILSDNSNTNINGNNRTNVRGDEIYYNMGSRKRQIDGNNNIYIRGNETKTVEGSGTLIVDGNVTVLIKGQCQVHVMQEAQIIVDKDATIQCNQNANINVEQKATIQSQNMDIDVEQDLNITATNINMNASGSTQIDSAALTKVTGGQVQVG